MQSGSTGVFLPSLLAPVLPVRAPNAKWPLSLRRAQAVLYSANLWDQRDQPPSPYSHAPPSLALELVPTCAESAGIDGEVFCHTDGDTPSLSTPALTTTKTAIAAVILGTMSVLRRFNHKPQIRCESAPSGKGAIVHRILDTEQYECPRVRKFPGFSFFDRPALLQPHQLLHPSGGAVGLGV